MIEGLHPEIRIRRLDFLCKHPILSTFKEDFDSINAFYYPSVSASRQVDHIVIPAGSVRPQIFLKRFAVLIIEPLVDSQDAFRVNFWLSPRQIFFEELEITLGS
jgi:hypothetical protein